MSKKLARKFRKLGFRKVILTLLVLAILNGLGLWQIKEPEFPLLPIAGPTSSPLYQDFHLLLPKIGVNAPVIADVDGTNKEEYFKALEDGVAHFKGTAKPGQGSNIFIFGHSSFYWYKPGDYKEIFKELEQVAIGDEIILWYQSKEYKYKVVETKVVEPTEVEVLKQTQEEQVTLMTCVPVGTTRYRLIVIGKPIQ